MPKRFKQLSFDPKQFKAKMEFGGSLLKKANAREARPVSTKKPMHIVLRSSKAKGTWSLLKKENAKIVEKYLKRFSKVYGIRVYQAANSGNHLHLLVRVGHRRLFSAFLRAFAGAVAISITGANKFEGLKEKFWDYRPWSRVGTWGRAYSIAKDYLLRNHLEAIGQIPYERGISTKTILGDLNTT